MSLREIIESHVETVFLNPDHFAETVQLQRSAGSWKPVTANVTLEDSQRDYSGGDSVVINGMLDVSSVVKGFAKDGFVKVRGELFRITSVSLPEHGMITVAITRTASTRSNSSRLDPLV